MLHQASDVTSALFELSPAHCPDLAERIGHIRVELDAIHQDLRMGQQGRTSLQKVRTYLAARAAARRAFGQEMFSDPAWDILVQLYAQDLAERRTSMSELCAIAGVPTATGQRWMKQLEQGGHVERCPDPLDARKHRVQLTSTGRHKMEAFFDAIS